MEVSLRGGEWIFDLTLRGGEEIFYPACCNPATCLLGYHCSLPNVMQNLRLKGKQELKLLNTSASSIKYIANKNIVANKVFVANQVFIGNHVFFRKKKLSVGQIS